MSLLQFSHDYTNVGEAYALLYLALEALHFRQYADVNKEILAARKALSDYLSRDNMRPAGDVENGWVRMDDALQLTFSRYQLELVNELFCEYLRKYPDCLLASDYLSVVNRCRELLEKPGFANVQECITSK